MYNLLCIGGKILVYSSQYDFSIGGIIGLAVLVDVLLESTLSVATKKLRFSGLIKQESCLSICKW